jgi:hypothetical protein
MRKRFLNLAIVFMCLALSFTSSKSLADPDDLSETETRAARAQVSWPSCLTRESYQLAGELGLVDLLTRLQRLHEHNKHKTGSPLSPESTTWRLEIAEVVLTTALQCQAVIAQIETETAGTLEIKAALEGQRDKSSRTNAKANVIANGSISTFGNLLQMPFETTPDSRYELPGEIVESAGTIMAAGLGGIALRQSRGTALSAPIEPNMLAKIFKRPNNSKTEYPDVIWRYLNSVPPGPNKNTMTRRELLIERWIELGRVPPLNTEKGRVYARTLAGTIPQNKAVTIDMLEDRAAMLLDLRAEVNQIYKELLNMMLVVRAL